MNKSTEQLRREYDEAQVKLQQAQNRLARLENRIKYQQKGDRAKRTHQLCNIGGAVKALAPGIEELPKSALYELMEQVFTLPEVRAIIDASISREGK